MGADVIPVLALRLDDVERDGPLALDADRRMEPAAGPRRRREHDAAGLPSYRTDSVGIDRVQGPLRLALGVTRLKEQGTVIGSRFAPVLFRGGASTLFLDGAAAVDLGARWNATSPRSRPG